MGQKVNPISLRLEQTNRHFDSCWFNDYNYTYLLNRDIKIQSYINSILKQIRYCSARFFIQNLPNKIKINVFFINPKNIRKTSSKVFKLPDSFNTEEIKVPGTTNRVVGNVRKQKLQSLARKLNLTKKKLFLKQNKTQTISKAKILNYFLLNAQNSSKQRNSIPMLKNVVLNNQSLVSSKPISNFIQITKTENQNRINVFLRYLLLKNFSLKSGANFKASKAQGFLFSNLINLKLLSSNNKLFLITNYLQEKILNNKTDLQQKFLNNTTKFSKAYSNKLCLFKVLPKKALKPTATLALNKQSNKKSFSSYLDSINVKLEKTENSISAKHNVSLNEKAFNLLDILYSSQKSSYCLVKKKTNNVSTNFSGNTLNTNNDFLSLMNNELLSNTHYNLEKKFKKFSNYSNKPLKDGAFKNTNSIESKDKLFLQNANYKSNKTKVLFIRNSTYKTHLESQLSNFCFSDVVVSFFRLSNEKQSAIFLAEEIIYYLEKKVSFLKIKNQILRQASDSSFLKGLRITCSGRVGGRSKKAQRSKVQVIKYGQTSLHVFSSKIDFASKPANTAFGLLGVKVWICYH